MCHYLKKNCCVRPFCLPTCVVDGTVNCQYVVIQHMLRSTGSSLKIETRFSLPASAVRSSGRFSSGSPSLMNKWVRQDNAGNANAAGTATAWHCRHWNWHCHCRHLHLQYDGITTLHQQYGGITTLHQQYGGITTLHQQYSGITTLLCEPCLSASKTL